MLPVGFWENDTLHVAINPYQPADSERLEDFVASSGRRGLCLFQTSGSEGLPKWVALSKDAFLISARAVNDHFQVVSGDRWLMALPLHHVGGFSILARAHLSASSVVHSDSRWQPTDFVRLLNAEGITLVSLVPTQVHDLVRERLPCPTSLRAAIIGGGGMSRELAQAARALGWPVFQSYGMTEAASQIATQPLADDLELGQLEILPHWRTRQDEQGRLIIGGPALAQGYVLRGPDGVWSWQDIGDELVTRDLVRLGRRHGRTWLEFAGREAGFVKILGELVHLAPLQARLEALALEQGILRPPVLVSLTDARRESRLVLVAESEEAAALLAPYNATATPLHQASECRRLTEIPRSDLGKIHAARLREMLISGQV